MTKRYFIYNKKNGTLVAHAFILPASRIVGIHQPPERHISYPFSSDISDIEAIKQGLSRIGLNPEEHDIHEA